MSIFPGEYHFEVLANCGLSYLQPDVAICGGLTVCREVTRICEGAGIRAVPHCFSTGINLAASLQWISTDPAGDLIEYCLQPSPFMRRLVTNLPTLENGRVPVPKGPGLGIELDEEIIEEYRVRA